MSDIRLPEPAPGARLLSLGTYRPRRVVDNAEIATMIETSDEWIQKRSGIRERRWAAADETLLYMAEMASKDAIARAGVDAADVDLVLLATCTSLSATPTTANLLQDRIGAKGAALEVNSACAGFCYALGVANDAIRAGTSRLAVVVGVERITDILDMNDRSTMFLFGDGAGATVVEAADAPYVGPTVWGSWGNQADALDTQPPVHDYVHDATLGRPHLRMHGQAVFRWAITEMPKVAQAALDAAGVKVEQLAAFIPHQANTRIVDSMVRGLRLPEHVVVADDIKMAGNTSAASVPLAMEQLLSSGRARSGDLALLIGFGGGLSHAAQVVALP